MVRRRLLLSLSFSLSPARNLFSEKFSLSCCCAVVVVSKRRRRRRRPTTRFHRVTADINSFSFCSVSSVCDINSQERNPSSSSQSSVRRHERTNLSVVVDGQTPPGSIFLVARPIHASSLDWDSSEKRGDGTGGEVQETRV